jgi:hypothetical protein
VFDKYLFWLTEGTTVDKRFLEQSRSALSSWCELGHSECIWTPKKPVTHHYFLECKLAYHSHQHRRAGESNYLEPHGALLSHLPINHDGTYHSGEPYPHMSLTWPLLRITPVTVGSEILPLLSTSSAAAISAFPSSLPKLAPATWEDEAHRIYKFSLKINISDDSLRKSHWCKTSGLGSKYRVKHFKTKCDPLQGSPAEGKSVRCVYCRMTSTISYSASSLVGGFQELIDRPTWMVLFAFTSNWHFQISQRIQKWNFLILD